MFFSKKRLASFGDSWPQGSELLPGEKTFGELLAERLECINFSNYSCPASSINHLLVQFKRHLKTVSDLIQDPSEWAAVFFLTDQNRGATYNKSWIFQNAGGGFSEKVPFDREQIDSTNNAYWKYIYSDELSELTANSTILSLQTLCRQYSIDDYYITGWHDFNFWPEININRFYAAGQVTAANLIKDNRAPGGHPNQQGHQLISDALYSWIKNCAE